MARTATRNTQENVPGFRSRWRRARDSAFSGTGPARDLAHVGLRRVQKRLRRVPHHRGIIPRLRQIRRSDGHRRTGRGDTGPVGCLDSPFSPGAGRVRSRPSLRNVLPLRNPWSILAEDGRGLRCSHDQSAGAVPQGTRSIAPGVHLLTMSIFPLPCPCPRTTAVGSLQLRNWLPGRA